MIPLKEKIRLLFGKMYTIDELTDFKSYDNYQDIKEKCKIVVIDDEDFPKYEQLKRRNYNIVKREDVFEINDIRQYDIVITDIRGVGSRLSDKLEGGAIVKEVKKNYPDKYVIIYSASQFDSCMNDVFHLADDILKKDDDIERWVDCIDNIINNIVDAKKCWIKYRNKLNELKVSSKDIAYIEHLYVSSLLDKDNKLISVTCFEENVKPIVQSIIASYIFKVMGM